ncbi:putative transcription factor Nin-like family [Medicago truncatula]|uniref:Nodule inception protein n=18 Tax=Medicago truncatula TaxID=3880 RepID=C0LLV9_MEDTR|nr:protein NLP5 [Medicago truncatula]AET75785.1 NIN [Cloning vector pHUGE-MtNFS]AET75797.1 NIN [Cloning vector pHUGE-LjMtNFS]ACN58567.1 nodule inception protein [Medicago truncatula]AET01067.1 nodule inception protein [Medicago truncatula]RHN58208.1 putative transcription factor Nin-like family [Medicago truncatula]
MEYGGGLVADGGVFGPMVGGGGGDQADIIEELLGEGCWIEASENSLMAMQQTTPQSQYMSNNNNIPMGMGEGDHFNHHHHHHPHPHHQMECTAPAANHDDQQESGFVVGKRWWIGPRANPGPTTSVKERLVVAVGYLKEYTKNSSNNVLIQIWVPMRRRSALIHTQNHYLQQESSSAPVSVNPNMNVHVRFFRSHDYPRHQQQQQYGSLLALPVFERGSGTCLGVIEFVISNQTLINYRPQLDHLSNALEAVDFRSSHNMNIPQAVKVFEELYEAAVNEIMEVLASVCKTHNLPLALTWAPCLQQQQGGGKGSSGASGCGVSTMSCCISTVDSACYVGDMDVLGFQEACSEYHLFNGQGIVGTAFTTTKPCFAIDITAFSKSEYPLAHHANMFGLHAAVAIPLRSVYTGSAADFVLEFFLPKDCRDTEQQKQMLNSLSLVVQQACRSLHLHVVMDDNNNNNMNDNNSSADHDHDQFTFPTTNSYMPSSASEPLSQVDAVSGCSTKDTSSSCSWIAHMMEAQNKGKGVSVSLEYLQEPKEEFKVTTCNWDREREDNVFSEFGQVLQQQQHDQSSNSRASVVSVEAGEESPGACGRRSSSSSSGRKSGDKRRTKAEKTISLPVLRQYFAGSLKDAAKSIGVCPTTLKRICRQHGITRWPSRKIKKVGHSLKKLQLVIDSVQGAEGAIQIGSFYASFPELSNATANGGDGNDNSNNSFYNNNHGDGIVTSLKSPPSACSQTHAGNKLPMTTTTAINHHHVVMTENPTGAPLGVDHAFMHASNINIQDYHQLQEDLDTKQLLLHFNNNNQILPPRPTVAWNNNNSSSSTLLERGAFRVKATFADEKIRFSLQAMWGFRDLQLEIARRFNLTDMNNLVLKYLDDEGEWVVLSCDADLEECKDLHTSSHTRTIRLSLFQASPLNLPNTFRNSSSSSPSS